MQAELIEQTFRLPGFDESEVVTDACRLQDEFFLDRGFERKYNGNIVFFTRENDTGGDDYLPFVVRLDDYRSGSVPVAVPDKDRWLEGYEGAVLIKLGVFVWNRQYVTHPLEK